MNKRLIVSLAFVGIVMTVIVSYSSYYFTLLETQNQIMAGYSPNQNIIAGDTTVVNLENASPPLGSDSAPITIVEFGDYQCEACAHWFHTTRPDLIDNYIETGKAKLVFVDIPFLGRDSPKAAQASYCADDQGKYWEYHSLLYTFQNGPPDSGWANQERLISFAYSLNLNVDEFSECLDSSKYVQRVKANQSEAIRNGADMTPTFIVFSSDGAKEQFSGSLPISVFMATIESML